MAAFRSRRQNAGAKMASLLNEEEKAVVADDFYSTTYGGFTEENDDKDFAYHSPAEDEDAVDSDFSIDENDEPRSDVEGEDEDGKKRAKRSKGVVTKAYKEPVKKDPSKTQERPKKKVPPSDAIKAHLMDFGRKEARASTIMKTSETAKRQKERMVKAKRLLKKRLALRKEREEPPLSQAELLEEAKITEKLNIASLKTYEQMELEAKKKAHKVTRRQVVGPYIRYLSTTMPAVQVRRSIGCHAVSAAFKLRCAFLAAAF
jgi:vacuolar protein sorting-associated protein 72